MNKNVTFTMSVPRQDPEENKKGTQHD